MPVPREGEVEIEGSGRDGEGVVGVCVTASGFHDSPTENFITSQLLCTST